MELVDGIDHTFFSPRNNLKFEHARLNEVNFDKLLEHASILLSGSGQNYPGFFAGERVSIRCIQGLHVELKNKFGRCPFLYHHRFDEVSTQTKAPGPVAYNF